MIFNFDLRFLGLEKSCTEQKEAFYSSYILVPG